MGLLNRDSSERSYLASLQEESFKMLGELAYFFEAKETYVNIYNDKTHVYDKDLVKINILFESHPKPILKKLGWYSEDFDGILIYLPRYDDEGNEIVPREGSIIVVYNTQLEFTKRKAFIITQIAGEGLNPIFWYANIAPYRRKITVTPEVNNKDAGQDTGIKFTNRDKVKRYVK